MSTEQTAAERLRDALGRSIDIEFAHERGLHGLYVGLPTPRSTIVDLLAEHEALAARVAALEGPMGTLELTHAELCETGNGYFELDAAVALVLDAWNALDSAPGQAGATGE